MSVREDRSELTARPSPGLAPSSPADVALPPQNVDAGSDTVSGSSVRLTIAASCRPDSFDADDLNGNSGLLPGGVTTTTPLPFTLNDAERSRSWSTCSNARRRIDGFASNLHALFAHRIASTEPAARDGDWRVLFLSSRAPPCTLRCRVFLPVYLRLSLP